MVDNPQVSFGIFTDVQYADRDPSLECPSKVYRNGLRHLKTAVDGFINDPTLDFTVQLGDLIEGSHGQNFEGDCMEFRAVNSELQRLVRPHYNVLGNHCLSLPRPYLYKELAMPAPYYSFSIKGFRFVVLDSQDMALSWPQETANHQLAQSWLDANGEEKNCRAWNGGLMQSQLSWLEEQIEAAKIDQQRVIVFAHMPTAPCSGDDFHLMFNHSDVLNVLLRHRHCVAYFSGHDHSGGYCMQTGADGNRCHFVTMPAAIEAGEGPCHAFVRLFDDRIVLDGRGTVPARELLF